MTGTDGALFLCRFSFDAAALFLWGSSAYLGTLVPDDLRLDIWSRLNGLRRAAIAALVLSTLASLPVRTALIAGWESALDAEILSAVAIGTNLGAAWVIQFAAVTLLIMASHLPVRHCIAATAMLSAALLASLSVSGHAAMNPGWTGRFHQANDIVHLLASGAWLGALPPVLLILSRLREGQSPRQAALALLRFSTAGHVTVALVVLSGVANTLFVLGGLPTDPAIAYQRLLLIKVGLVAAMIAIAIVNRYVLVPRMHVARGAGRAIAILTWAEIFLGAAVIALVAWFGSTDPER